MATQKNSKKRVLKNDELASIAEILALMDETNKNKEWLVHQIKKEKLKLPVSLSLNSFQILKQCPPKFIKHVLHKLSGTDLDDYDISALTKTYHWFFTDIISASSPKIPTKSQVRKIFVLNELLSRTETFEQRDRNSTVLPTGDGMVIGFADSPEKPLRLAMQLHKAIFKYNASVKGKDKLLIRVGIDTGPVYMIKDLNGQDTVWGPGIIMSRRVMDLCGDMNILASSRIAEDIRNLSPEYKEIMHPIGDYEIKHGDTLSLYNIYGDNFGNKIPPRKSKIIKQKETEEDFKGINTFEFANLEINLDVLDTKTMLTHHTWIWNVINISKESKDQVFYYLEGDSPKDFADMNVRVTDEEGHELDIVSLSVNKPYHKEFNIKLKKPLKPRQRKRYLKLEYDWEEPERNFFYKLATDCKNFKYRFTIPSGIDVKNRILKVDTEMGYKWHASPPPVINFLDDYTEIKWDAKNLKAYDAYKFEW